MEREDRAKRRRVMRWLERRVVRAVRLVRRGGLDVDFVWGELGDGDGRREVRRVRV